jgi:hypothetical protein
VGLKFFKVYLDPQVSWRSLKSEEVRRGLDPIHPREAGYGKWPPAWTPSVWDLESGGKKRARSNSTETGDAPRSLANIRPRIFGAATSGGREEQRGGGGGRGEGQLTDAATMAVTGVAADSLGERAIKRKLSTSLVVGSVLSCIYVI